MRSILKIVWQSWEGKVGIVLLFILTVTSFWVIATFPRDFGEAIWNNPAYWADNPKAVPPNWVRIFDSEKTTHQVFRERTPEIVQDDPGKVYLYRFEVKRSAENLPTFVSFSVSDILFYQDPPIIEVYSKKQSKEFLLYRQMVPPLRGEELPPFSRYKEEPLRKQLEVDGLSGDVEIRIHLAHHKDEVGEVKLVLGGEALGISGTDNVGRDLFQALLFAIPIVLFIALTVTLGAESIGIILGALSGYHGGKVDFLIQRLADININLPVFPLLVFMIFVLGAQLSNLLIILIAFGWAGLVINYRPWILQIRESNFIAYCQAQGFSASRIIFRHLIPQTLPFLFAVFAMTIPLIILTEAGLSFIGLGIPGLPTWGQILHQAYNTGAIYLGYLWWVIPPGIAISLTGLTFALWARALESLAEPGLRRQ